MRCTKFRMARPGVWTSTLLVVVTFLSAEVSQSAIMVGRIESRDPAKWTVQDIAGKRVILDSAALPGGAPSTRTCPTSLQFTFDRAKTWSEDLCHAPSTIAAARDLLRFADGIRDVSSLGNGVVMLRGTSEISWSLADATTTQEFAHGQGLLFMAARFDDGAICYVERTAMDDSHHVDGVFYLGPSGDPYKVGELREDCNPNGTLFALRDDTDHYIVFGQKLGGRAYRSSKPAEYSCIAVRAGTTTTLPPDESLSSGMLCGNRILLFRRSKVEAWRIVDGRLVSDWSADPGYWTRPIATSADSRFLALCRARVAGQPHREEVSIIDTLTGTVVDSLMLPEDVTLDAALFDDLNRLHLVSTQSQADFIYQLSVK